MDRTASHSEVRDFEINPDEYPFYARVPTNILENLKYRQRLLDEAINDKGLQRDLLDMCRQDTLFFVNTFCWLFEPRPLPKIVPFVMWPHQVPVFVAMEQSMGIEDVGLEKSRGEGASWMALTLVFKWWLFNELFACGLVSRSEEAVDDENDPDSLMWKLDFQMKRLPYWMKPGRGDPKAVIRRSHGHILKNVTNEATIVGYSAVGDVASGGRKTCFVMDEMAKFRAGSDYDAMSSTQYVTECRYIISTFKGNTGAYYDALRGPSSIKKLFLDWKDNPTRNQGIYEVQQGNLVMLDPITNPLPSNYHIECKPQHEQLRNRGYTLEGTIRSPWYDKQCARTNATSGTIAEELDRDPTRSGTPYFDIEVIERLLKECRSPVHIGNIDFTKLEMKPEFIENPRGKWKLWCKLGMPRKPQSDRDYTLGIDIAAGGGGPMASNSVISVVDNKTGLKVAEYADPSVYPHDLAALAYATSKFFSGKSGMAYLIHESNGTTGSQFSRAIMDLGHPHLFLQSDEMRLSGKRTRKPGFHNQGIARGVLYGGYRASLADGTFTNLSREALTECKSYEHIGQDKIEHSSAARKGTDPSGAGHNHGDRCTADALACRALRDFTKPLDSDDEEEDKAPPGSFMWRRKQSELSSKKDDWW